MQASVSVTDTSLDSCFCNADYSCVKKNKILSQEEDRISQLPEPLISEILGHLSTKDAVRTSVLSTRWRNLMFLQELVRYHRMRHKKNRELKMMFATLPRCLVTSLKFVEWKRSIPGYEGETELVRYFLKNSTILENLRLDVYYSEKAKSDFLKEVLTVSFREFKRKLV